MKKLSSIRGIPLEYIQSMLKIDEDSPSGLTWLPRDDVEEKWNSRYANKNAGCKVTNASGYKKWNVQVTYNDKKNTLLCSRIIFLLHNGYLTKDKEIDHADGNSLNNKINNLRESTRDQNQHNAKLQKNNKSGVKGVSWNVKSKKWRVTIMVNKKRYNFGLYEKLEDAIKVAIEARKKLHGEFMRNF